MESLIHLPLEPYKQRYTEYLAPIEAKVLKQHFTYKAVVPDESHTVLNIRSGRVLDTFNRPLWALEQTKQLLLSASSDLGKLYFSDFYHPGLDAIAYSGAEFEASAFLWAQTFDQYDFTQSMANWMRPWEIMAMELYSHVFVASSLLQELIHSALPHVVGKIHVVGLPFSSRAVGKYLDTKAIPADGYDVVYSSRWDTEKNPEFFLELATRRPDLKMAVCTGAEELQGNDIRAVERAKRMGAMKGNFYVHTGLTKGQYFAILSKSKVQFNCSLQDWVSFTLLEALTFGCSPLYPNARSFPEALNGYNECMYQPHNIEDALDRLDNLLTYPADKDFTKSILEYHDGTISRIAELLK